MFQRILAKFCYTILRQDSPKTAAGIWFADKFGRTMLTSANTPIIMAPSSILCSQDVLM